MRLWNERMVPILLVSLSMAGTVSVLEAQPAPERSPATSPRADGRDAEARKLLDGAVLRVNGGVFPRIADPGPGKRAGAGVCCTVGETRSQSKVAAIELMTPKGLNKNRYVPPDGPMERVYSPPQPCWVISSYQRIVTEANGPREASDDAQPAKFSYLTNKEFESVEEEMKEIVAKLDILDEYKADLEAKIEQFVKSYGTYTNSISTSHGQVRHVARVRGQGNFNGRAWYSGHIAATETCCPPEITDAAALRRTLRQWIDETASKLPKRPKLFGGVKLDAKALTLPRGELDSVAVRPDPCNTCPLAGSRYDGANCFVARPPAGTEPFVYDGALYYTPPGGSQRCPLAGSRYDGANCFVARPPAGTEPFVYDGALYHTPKCG